MKNIREEEVRKILINFLSWRNKKTPYKDEIRSNLGLPKISFQKALVLSMIEINLEELENVTEGDIPYDINEARVLLKKLGLYGPSLKKIAKMLKSEYISASEFKKLVA